MINLLPPKEKELLKLEINKRLVSILWFLFLFFLFCFILILFPIKNYMISGIASERIFLEKAKDPEKQSEFENIQKKFNSFNEVLEEMNSLYSQRIYFSKIIVRISELLPPNSYLNSISLNYSPGEKDKKTIQAVLSGFIPNRESLFDFKKTVEKEKGIEEVSFPTSNWIKPTDINFSVIFTLLNNF